MFSALNQNSPLYIITKGNKLEYKVGSVKSLTASRSYSSYGVVPTNTVDINVEIDGSVQTFKNVPANMAVANFTNDGLVISETKEGLIPELDNIIQTSEFNISNYEKDKEIVASGKEIMKKINVKYAKDSERDDAISMLKSDVTNMKGDINKILNILTRKENI